MTDLTREEIAELERRARQQALGTHDDGILVIETATFFRLLAMVKDKDAAVERARVEEQEACALLVGSWNLLRGETHDEKLAIQSTLVDASKAIRSRTANAVASATSETAREPSNSVDYQQQRGAGWDIIDEAINAYDEWMLDDDYDANRVLAEIMAKMRERRNAILSARGENERLRQQEEDWVDDYKAVNDRLAEAVKVIEPLRAALENVLEAVSRLGAMKDGKTLFESSIRNDEDAYQAWLVLNNSISAARSALRLAGKADPVATSASPSLRDAALEEAAKIADVQTYFPDTNKGMRQQWVKDQIALKIRALKSQEPSP